jgi:hypothetical protein
MAAGYGVGASLAGMGLQQKSEALGMLRTAADQESARNRENQVIEAQEEAGKKQLGSTLGSLAGMSVGGPWGAMIGGAAGAVIGGLL